MYCEICCENKETLETCPFCDESCCLECIQKGLLANETEPYCMFCKKLYSMEHIMTINPRPWIKKMFLPHMSKIRVKQEMNLLLGDQLEAKTILKVRALRKEYSKLPLIKKIRKTFKDPKQLQSKLEEVRKEQLRIRKEIRKYETQDILYMKQCKKVSFYGFCPVDKCKGMLDENFKCQLCDVNVCHDCGEINLMNHQCLEENKKSFQSVQKESKPCPQCGVPIFQSSGCDQMWCVLCFTPFSWSSGKRIDGVIHNPHYYEWLKSSNNVDVEPELNCEELPTAVQFSSFLNYHYPDQTKNWWYKIHQTIIHLREIVFPLVNQNRVPNNKSLRIQYLVGDIDENRWRNLLQYREERRMKLNALYLITDLNIQLFTDLISKFIKDPKNPPAKEEIRNIWNFIENNLDRSCRIYGGNLPNEWKQVLERMKLF